MNQEKVLIAENPAMWGLSPILFILSVILILVYGVGLLFLLILYISTKATELTITEKEIILRRGLLSKSTNEVQLTDIKNIQIEQSFLQRIVKVGSLSISSAGTGHIEIVASGFKNPEGLKRMIKANN